MNNVTNIMDYRLKKLTANCINFKPEFGTKAYNRILRDIINANKEIEK